MKICLFDPGLEDNNRTLSSNLGDLIIQEAVEREIAALFPNCSLLHIATHTPCEDRLIEVAKDCKLCFVGGTNLLSSRMDEWRKWRFSIRQQLKLSRSILFGVGWQNYQEKPNFKTGIILKLVLSSRFLHSVRDSYTQSQLNCAGIRNVINTGCPTMWPLADLNMNEIPSSKADNALIMLTDYAKEPDLDRQFIELILTKYKKVYIWLQGRGDQEYLENLAVSHSNSLIILEHSYNSFQNFLSSGVHFDYIGTRLHGGIKCLLAKKRSLVIEIDNRAKEIAKDTGLPTVERANLQKIAQWIEYSDIPNIRLNNVGIKRWKKQFSLIYKRALVKA